LTAPETISRSRDIADSKKEQFEEKEKAVQPSSLYRWKPSGDGMLN